MERQKKRTDGLLCPAILGILLGIFSKAVDFGSYGAEIGWIYAIGLVTSGFTPWVLLASYIALKSKSDIRAALRVGIFLLTMLIGYYIYSFVFANYLSLRVVKFWLIMVIPSVVLAYFCRRIKANKFLRFFAMLFAAVLSLYSIVRIESLQIQCILIEVILFVLIIRVWYSEKS